MKILLRKLALPVVLVLVAAVAGVLADSQAKGRYKKDGTNCVWDANDSGPNQCAPVTTGRFKKDGDACVWEANGQGADECTPKSGRFKKDGDKCVWTPGDNGPNQCDPRKAR